MEGIKRQAQGQFIHGNTRPSMWAEMQTGRKMWREHMGLTSLTATIFLSEIGGKLLRVKKEEEVEVGKCRLAGNLKGPLETMNFRHNW